MKMNYKGQLILSIAIILIGNTMNMLLHHWAFSSAGKIICGLLWVIHPVMIGTRTPTKRELNWIRAAGGFLILWGFFSRLYLY